jgi:hypothetical protein
VLLGGTAVRADELCIDVTTLSARPEAYPQEVAQNSVVFIRTGTDVFTALGFVVASVGNEYRIVTALHAIYDRDTKQRKSPIMVALSSALVSDPSLMSQSNSNGTWVVAQREEESLPSRGEEEFDIAVLRAPLPYAYVSSGYRPTREVEAGSIHVSHYDSTRKLLTFSDGKRCSMRQLRGRATAPVEPGDSGGPVFDERWHLIGMTTNQNVVDSECAGVLFLTWEDVETFLLSHGIKPNLPTADEVVREKRIKDERDEREQSVGGYLFGASRVESARVVWSGPPTLAQFGGYIEGHIGSLGPFGVRFMGLYKLTAGYTTMEKSAYGELGGEVGAVGYVHFPDFDFSLMLAWSPSFILWDDASPRLVFVPAGYSVGARANYKGVALGIGVRAAAPPGGRAELVEPNIFFETMGPM